MDRDEAAAANERIATMAEELRKAEQVRDRLEEVDRLMGSYREGHDMRARLRDLHLRRALERVEEDIRLLTYQAPYRGPPVSPGDLKPGASYDNDGRPAFYSDRG